MTVRRVYLDCEFLPADPTNNGLVSIGLTDDQGVDYYAVNRDMDWEHLLTTPWMVENVLPSLPTYESNSRIVPATELATWHDDVRRLEKIREQVAAYFADTDASETRLYAYYGGQDIGRLHMLWDNNWASMPAFVPQWFTELQALIVDAGNPRLPAQEAGEHHALADARYNRQIHEHLMVLEKTRTA